MEFFAIALAVLLIILVLHVGISRLVGRRDEKMVLLRAVRSTLGKDYTFRPTMFGFKFFNDDRELYVYDEGDNVKRIHFFKRRTRTHKVIGKGTNFTALLSKAKTDSQTW